MFEKQKQFAREHIFLTSFHHLAGGFGLAIVLQHYLNGNSFLPIAFGWILVGFTVAVHLYEFIAPAKASGTALAYTIVFLGAGGVFSSHQQTFAKDAVAKTRAPYDVEFLDQFSKHHKDAIKMGELALSKAKSAEVKKMAKKMVSDQKEEVSQMKKWRDQLYSSAPKAKSAIPKMDMMSLKEKSGTDFDLAFLDMMTKHHEQGINMAKSAADKLFNPQIKTFAQNAIMNQDRERQELEAMKKSEASHGDMMHE